MKNPTGTDLPVSQAHGGDSTSQYTLTTTEIALNDIITKRLGLKLREGDLLMLKEDLNSRFGAGI